MVPLKISKTRSRLAIGMIVLAHIDLVALFVTGASGLAIHAALLVALILAATVADRRKVWWMVLPVLGAALAILVATDGQGNCVNRPGSAEICFLSI